MQQIQMQQILTGGPITSFYFTFAKRLVKELKRLLEKGGLLLKQGTDEITGQFETIDNCCTTTLHARTVLHYITEQFPGVDLGSYSSVSKNEILSVIETAEKFLALFERKISGPIEKGNFSVRTSNTLQRMRIKTWGELSNTTEADLTMRPGFGKTSLREVVQKLKERGLSLKSLAIGED